MSDYPNNPLSRTEQYLNRIANGQGEIPEEPISRIEHYLAYLCGQNVVLPNNPVSRVEEYLAYICENGGGGDITVETLNAVENGTYTAPLGKAYSPVNVNVPTGDDPVIEPLSVTENGTYTVPSGTDGYSPITVNVPSEEPVLQDKTFTSNGTYTADTGYDGFAEVTVAVPTPEPVIESLYITENGTYTAPSGIDGYSPITVNVSGGGGTITGKTIDVTTSASIGATLTKIISNDQDIAAHYADDSFAVFVQKNNFIMNVYAIFQAVCGNRSFSGKYGTYIKRGDASSTTVSAITVGVNNDRTQSVPGISADSDGNLYLRGEGSSYAWAASNYKVIIGW